MRRFATWTTGHRKTVIIAWIVALIGIGAISGTVGSDFTEEFKLPASDSQEAFELLETASRRSRETPRRSSSRPTDGVASPAVKKQMDGLFPKAEGSTTSAKSPAPTPVTVPGRSATTARSPTRRPVRRLRQQARQRPDQELIDAAEAASGSGLKVDARRPADRGSREEEGGDLFLRSACWPPSSSCCSPSARRSRWACRSSRRCSRSESGSAW